MAGPEILLLSLAMQPFLDDTYMSLFNSLGDVAQLKRAKAPDSAMRYLEANNPKAIIATDEGLTEAKNRAVLEKVKSYIRNGGIVIFGLHFPNFTNLDNFDNLFAGFGLAWKHGDYHRTTFQFNPSCSLPAGAVKDSFPPAYSMKVLHIMDARQEEKIFVPVPEGKTQSLVFPPTFVDQAQAAVVGTKIGDGYLFYTGDVNGEEGSDKVILALLGL
jgi:hypothetical protein